MISVDVYEPEAGRGLEIAELPLGDTSEACWTMMGSEKGEGFCALLDERPVPGRAPGVQVDLLVDVIRNMIVILSFTCIMK